MTVQRVEFTTNILPQTELAFSDSGPKAATALICENALLLGGLQHILSGTPFLVAEGASAAEPRQLRHPLQEHALFIIAAGPDFSRVSEIVRQVKELSPKARIVALADHFDLNFILQGREAGIDGFCLTATDRAVLIKSLELVMLGEPVLPSKLICSVVHSMSPSPQRQIQPLEAKSKLATPGGHKLSAREAEILSCLMDGAPNKVIARKLDVAEATIKVHVKAILRKLGAVNRTQAAMWATAYLPPKVPAEGPHVP